MTHHLKFKKVRTLRTFPQQICLAACCSHHVFLPGSPPRNAAVGQLVQRPRAPTQLCSARSLHPDGCPAERWQSSKGMLVGDSLGGSTRLQFPTYPAWVSINGGYRNSWMTENGKSDEHFHRIDDLGVPPFQETFGEYWGWSSFICGILWAGGGCSNAQLRSIHEL